MIFKRETVNENVNLIDEILESDTGLTPDEAGILQLCREEVEVTNNILESAYMIDLLHEDFEATEDGDAMLNLCEAQVPKFVEKFIAAIKAAIAKVKEFFGKLFTWIDANVKNDKAFLSKYKSKFKANPTKKVKGYDYKFEAITKIVDRVKSASASPEAKALLDLAGSEPTAERAESVTKAYSEKGKAALAGHMASQLTASGVTRMDEMKEALINEVRGKATELALTDGYIKAGVAFLEKGDGFKKATKELMTQLNKDKAELIKGAKKVKGDLGKAKDSKDVVNPGSVLAAAKEAITTIHTAKQQAYSIALGQFKAGRVFWKGFLTKTLTAKAVSESTMVSEGVNLDDMITYGL